MVGAPPPESEEISAPESEFLRSYRSYTHAFLRMMWGWMLPFLLSKDDENIVKARILIDPTSPVSPFYKDRQLRLIARDVRAAHRIEHLDFDLDLTEAQHLQPHLMRIGERAAQSSGQYSMNIPLPEAITVESDALAKKIEEHCENLSSSFDRMIANYDVSIEETRGLIDRIKAMSSLRSAPTP